MDNILKRAMLQQCVLVKSGWATLGSAEDSNHGLCEHIKACSGDHEERLAIQNALRGCFLLWPEYSGDLAYPVPSPDGYKDDAECAYPVRFPYGYEDDAECAYDNLDLWTGPYGEARMRLLDFIIQTLSEELHNAV